MATAPRRLASIDDVQWDSSQLDAAAAAGRGEHFLLTWLNACEKAEAIYREQPQLLRALLGLVQPPSPLASSPPSVKPGRPARALIARIIITVLSRGDQKSLYDVAQHLLRGVSGSEGKGAPEREKEWRIASTYILGEVYAVFGSQVMSLYIDIVTTTTRVARTTSLPVILRHSALACLRKVLDVVAKSMSDQTIKDTLKALKAGLSEKAGAIVRASAECLLSMSAAAGTYSTLAEINEVLIPAFRALETADFVTRRSLSRLAAGLLAATQVEGSAAQSAPAKASGKDAPADDDDDGYPAIGAPSTSSTTAKTLLSPIEMLAQLSSPFNRATSTRRFRNALIDVYAELFKNLGAAWVEHYYADILKHLIDQIGCGAAAGLGWIAWNPRAAERIDPTRARYDAIAARKAVSILLSDVISAQLLGEAGQIAALREVGTLYLKKWPSLMPNQPGPSKQTLLIAIDETTNLLRRLGCAPAAVQEVLYDPLVRLIAHPSHSVQIAAAWSLRTFCNAAPNRLSGTIGQVTELLNKDLTVIASDGPSSSAAVHRRAIGFAHSLAALINLIPHKPLYVSFDLSAKCMSLAIQLLKQSGNHELHISGVEIQVAWILVSALMSLGPHFVRLHLPQLLLLWRNALPKPTNKDASTAQVRGDNEWAFLLHIRECTLGAILSFLRHNGPTATSPGLVNEDTARRLALLLSNGFSFANSFTSSHQNLAAEQTPSYSSRLRLVDRDLMYRRRLYECFIAFGQSAATQQHQIALLQQSVAIISDPDRYFGESAMQAAATSGSFTSIWDETDGLAFGVTSLIQDAKNEVAGGDELANGTSGSLHGKLGRLNRDRTESEIEEQLRRPVLQAGEHDASVLTQTLASDSASALAPLREAPPPATGIVDAAIELFALYFPLQEGGNQAALVQQLFNNSRSFKLERNPGRRHAILANAITAVLGALRQSRRAIDGVQVATTMRDFVKHALLHSDPSLRQAAAESLGRLSALGGTSLMAGQIQWCVQHVVNNTNPDHRAGCALAFSQIYSHVGSLAAAPILKTVIDVLLSLAADPHPLVHYSALQSLSYVIDAASLSYAPYTNSTLGVLCKLYMQDTHEPEGGTPGSVNLRGDLPAYQAMCRVLDAIVGVLGPELQESERVREVVLVLLREFSLERIDEGIAVEAIKATQHFLIFAPDALDHAELVSNLRSQLSSPRQPLKVAAVNSVYQLVQRDASLMSKLGGDGLVRELFALLDDDTTIEGVRDAILSWLHQTADANPSGWIDLCQRIMSRAASADRPAEKLGPTVPGAVADEEVQGLGVADDSDTRPGAPTARASSRWRTQLFALECLHEVFVTVLKRGRREHFDVAHARALRASKRGLLITRVADLIKMAFTASTAQVMEIRLEGLVVLKDVIDNFGASQDIDFEDAPLLEQYQAPIAAALTPAFAADSYPEVIASAIQVCAVFVGSGVTKEIDKMGRILKLLTNALESCKDSDMTSIGDVKDLSSTAAVMLKTSILAAWARFQTASTRQPYLTDVIRPHLGLLCPFWVATLREYARIRVDTTGLASETSPGGTGLDSVYSGLSRETALPFYESAWPQILHAAATLLKAGEQHMIRALHGTGVPDGQPSNLARTKTSEPALFFWTTFGIAYETLCRPAAVGNVPAAEIQSIALDALSGLLRPDISGDVLRDEAIFEDICNLLFRLALTEGLAIKVRALEIAVGLVHSILGRDSAALDGSALRSNPRLKQCLQIATTVVRETLPPTSSSTRLNVHTLEAHAQHTRQAFALYANLADLLPASLRSEVYAIAFHLYSLLLKDEQADLDLAGPTLPVLKILTVRAFSRPTHEQDALPRVLNGMLSACLLNFDAIRNRTSPAALIKMRSNLLALVLLLSSIPPTVSVGREVVDHACYLLAETAQSGTGEAQLAARNCVFSLLVAASRAHTGTLAFCAGRLLPAVLEIIVTASQSKPVSTDVQHKLVDDALKASIAVLLSVPAERKTQSVSILLPVLLRLVSPASPGPSLRPAATSHLVSLASTVPSHFKEATAALDPEERVRLEECIRSALGQGARRHAAVGTPSEEAPRIELKMFG
ncbi:hypothetical protein JCM8202v2_005301 [Rhodotorula sphaerocarpa]